MDSINVIKDLLPFLVPLVVIQLILMVVALVHVIKHPKYKIGNMTIWILVVVFVNIIGPILYFVIGRGEEE